VSEKPKYALVNAYDDTVRTRVRELMNQTDMCQCEKCFLDACAMVFNNRTYNYTFFVTTARGELFAKIPEMNPVNLADLTVACIAAIEKVRISPNH